MSRFNLQHFDRSMPIADPETGLATPYFLEMMFGNTDNAEQAEETINEIIIRQVEEGSGIDIDYTDPQHPIISTTGSGGFTSPGGRLTLTSGSPVMTADVTGATTIYYTPYIHAYIPIWNGTGSDLVEFTELSQALSDNTKSPAAAAGERRCYDMFVWDDGGTIRCTRGPEWVRAQTFTVTIASPGVVTCASHGLGQGEAVVLSTTGALPTGLVAGTTYYVSKTSYGGSTFALATSRANAITGTNINTSGTQSGTHTITSYSSTRGTGAGTTEISRNTDGYYTNAVDITNGPAAGRGTYVGTIQTGVTAVVHWVCNPADANGGGAVQLGLWNAYNRERFIATSADTTAANYTTLTWRVWRDSQSATSAFVIGLPLDEVHYRMYAHTSNSTSNVARGVSAQFDHFDRANIAGAGFSGWGSNGANFGLVLSSSVSKKLLGGRLAVPLQISVATGTCSWTGNNGVTNERWNLTELDILA